MDKSMGMEITEHDPADWEDFEAAAKRPTAFAQTSRGKDFIQLRNGRFDLDLVFAPDGIERFDDAWGRRVEKHGVPIANIDDIVGSKQAANRQEDRESLPRLLSFKDWLKKQTC